MREHIAKIRSKVCWIDSVIKIYVERNLGFEAEHHARDLESIPGKFFPNYTKQLFVFQSDYYILLLFSSLE